MRAGDRPKALRPFIDLYHLLDPTVDEGVAHRQEYLGMLASPHVPVAELAQRALRALDHAGRLSTDDVVEASRSVLLRREKKLVRAQHDWLDRAAPNRPDDLAALLDALAVGLAHETVDLAEGALRVLAKHLPAAGAYGADVLRKAAISLDGDLRRQVDALLGPAARDLPPTASTGGALPVPGSPEPMPEPINSIAEVAGELAHLLREPDDPIRLERALAGVVRWVHTDRAALARALAPLKPAWLSPVGELMSAVAHRCRTATPDSALDRVAPPAMMIHRRMDELAAQLCVDPPPALLATPATIDGQVDPDRVLTLLMNAERDGWQPGPYDLSQALLRLPRAVDTTVHAKARRLASPAGVRLARWWDSGGLPDPVVSMLTVSRARCGHETTYEYGGSGCWCGRRPPVRRIAAFAPIGNGLLTVPAGLFDLPAGRAGYDRAYGSHWAPPMARWPMVLPGHREVIAAHVQPFLAPAADADRRGGAEVLPLLARSSGSFGSAMALALAYGLTARRDTDRLAAADAFIHLAGRGDLDGTLVGHELAELVAGGVVVLGRAVAALTETARAGAYDAVWETVRELLPRLLTGADPPPGTPDLLGLAAAAAAATGVRTDLPEVTAVAARGGRSRLVTEAARLARATAPSS